MYRRPGRRPDRHLAAALAALAGAALVAAGCSRLALDAVDQADVLEIDVEEVATIEVPAGFRAVQVAEGLTYPSAMAWDDRGDLYVLESHSVPIPTLEPRIFRLRGGEVTPVAMEGDEAPSGGVAVGLEHHDGWLYLSHEEADGSWGITRVPPAGGTAEAVLRGLPPLGDHWINHLLFDAAGDLYFGIGSATNSGVVSAEDPVNAKWLAKRPGVHDLPCRDLVLTGRRFEDENVLTPDPDDVAVTGAYQPYTQSGARRVAAAEWCSGAVYRLPAAGGPASGGPAGGGPAELVAWGFRNPVALALDADGEVLVGMHGADIRGTRPVRDDPDAIYRLRQGAWYGWPDFAADLRPVTDAEHQPPGEYLAAGNDALAFVVNHAASGLEPPDRGLLVATTAPHAALGGMIVLPAGGPFAAWAGQLLVSEMGDFRPTTDPVTPDVRAGFQLELVDLATGERTTFARNRGEGPPRPASSLDLDAGFERPVDVAIGPDGFLYVLDFGVFESTRDAARVLPKTGKVFRIEPRGATPR